MHRIFLYEIIQGIFARAASFEMLFPAANLELFRIIQVKNPIPIGSKEYLSPRNRGRERGQILAMVCIDSALIFRGGYFEWGQRATEFRISKLLEIG